MSKNAVLFRSLHAVAYRRLFISVTAANSGRWALLMAIGWLLEVRTHSPFWVGAGVFMVQAPIIVVSPLAGVYADRLDRGRTLASAFGAAAMICLLLVLEGWLAASIPIILVTALLFGVAYSFQAANWNALIPNLVSPPTLANAIALLTLARQGSEFLGPVLGSPLLARFGPAAVFALCAGCYATASTVAFRLPRRGGEKSCAVPVARALGDGFRYVRERPVVAVLILLVGLHCVLTMSYMGLLPQYTTEVMRAGSGLYGVLMTVMGLGAAGGTLVLAGLREVERRSGLFVAVTIVSGLSLVGLGLARNVMAALAAACLMGLSQAAFMTMLQVYIQMRVDDNVRGRVLSLFSVVTLGSMAFGNWLWGALGLSLGATSMLILLGASFAVWSGFMLGFSDLLKQAYRPASVMRPSTWGKPAL